MGGVDGTTRTEGERVVLVPENRDVGAATAAAVRGRGRERGTPVIVRVDGSVQGCA